MWFHCHAGESPPLTKMPRSNNNIERQLAEILQRPGESAADYVLRMAELNRPMRRRGSVRGMSRKNLVRRFSKLRKGSDPPTDRQHPAFVEFMRRKKEEFQRTQARRLASWIATYKRFESDPDYRKDFPWAPKPGESLEAFYRRQDAYMVKPWKAAAGRRSSEEKRTLGKNARIAQVKKMLGKNPNLKPADVAAKFGCSSKTASRDLETARK